MERLSSLVQQRWGSWGILILGLWAAILALVALARLALLSAVIGSQEQTNISQSQIWLVFILNGLLGLAFAASAYGLWSRRHWGRFLFMGSVAVWSTFYAIALFTQGGLSANSDYTPGSLAFNLMPYIGGVILSIWYLNMPRIKQLFDARENERMNESANQRISD